MNEYDQALRQYLYQSMPIHYNALVMEITNRCNARCRICYQSAGEQPCPQRIDLEAAKRCIREAAELETVGSRFHLAGGEAYLYPEDCFTLFRTARDAGFTMISTTTNGFWGRTLEKAREMCARMKESGVSSIELSADYWHGEFIPAESMSNCLRACREAEIEINLRLLTTKKHSMQEALQRLSQDAVAGSHVITSGIVFATGRAAEVLEPEEFYEMKGSIAGNCHDCLNLTVTSFGEVFPCCAGSDICRDFNFGNIREQSIRDIAAGMNKNPILRQLVFLGAGSFLPLLQRAGVDFSTENCFSMCQLCNRIFGSPTYLQAIRAEFDKAGENALRRALERLEAMQKEQELHHA